MAKVFNLGIGMIVVVPADDAYRASTCSAGRVTRPGQIGVVDAGTGDVRLVRPTA